MAKVTIRPIAADIEAVLAASESTTNPGLPDSFHNRIEADCAGGMPAHLDMGYGKAHGALALITDQYASSEATIWHILVIIHDCQYNALDSIVAWVWKQAPPGTPQGWKQTAH